MSTPPNEAAQAACDPIPGQGAMHSLTRSFRHRNFRLFFSGQIVSLCGTWMQNVAEAWLVYRLTGSAAALGLVRFAGTIPVLLLALVGGDWADRRDRRSIIVICQALSMVLAFILAALCFSGTITVWQVMVLAVLLGVVTAVDMPTRQSFIVEMVGKEDLPNAIGLNSSMVHTARILGPASAGALLAVVGEAWCFTINGFSFLAVIAGLMLMRLPARPKSKPACPMHQRIGQGLSYAWNHRDIRSLLALVATSSILGSSFLVLMPVFAEAVLHTGPAGLGVLMACAGIGSLLGALILAQRKHGNGLWTLRFHAAIAFGICLALFAASTNFILSCALLLPTGCTMILVMATSNTLLQSIVPDELRGRVMALFTMMFRGMVPFGALLSGFLAEALGARLSVGICGAICLAAALLLARPGRRGPVPGSEATA